jgi:hypothetical protein
MRLPDATPLTAAEAALSVPPWTSNVTVTSVRTPIKEIVLYGPGVSVYAYECPGATSAACLVELNGPALESLLPTGPVSAEAATYDEIHVGYCAPGETGWISQITGTTTIGGTLYYTRTAGNLGTTGPAEPVSVPYSGCGTSFAIVPPLVIADTAPTTILLRLYFDIRDLAYAALTDPSTNNARGFHCTGPATTGFVCAAYTTITVVPGTALPSVERYRINESATIGLMFAAATDRFVGGYTRRFYVEDALWNPPYTPDGHFETFTSSGTGTYRLAQRLPGAIFPTFQRASHSSTVIDHDGHHNPYTAVRLP